MHDLESQVAELQSRSVANESENASLRDIIAQLRDENARLAATTTEPTIPTISSSSVTLNSVASDAFQNSFLATMTGYGSLPTDVTPSYLAAPPLPLPLPAASTAPDFSVWREGSPLDAFPTSNTFAGLDEFLSLDALADGTAIPTWPSGPSSSSSEPRTPGDSGKPTAFDVENFCAEFRSKAQCSEVRRGSHLVIGSTNVHTGRQTGLGGRRRGGPTYIRASSAIRHARADGDLICDLGGALYTILYMYFIVTQPTGLREARLAIRKAGLLLWMLKTVTTSSAKFAVTTDSRGRTLGPPRRPQTRGLAADAPTTRPCVSQVTQACPRRFRRAG